MHEDDILKDEEPVLDDEPVGDDELDLGLDEAGKKKKDLIEDDTVSLEDEVDEELEEPEEPFDDVNPI